MLNLGVSNLDQFLGSLGGRAGQGQLLALTQPAKRSLDLLLQETRVELARAHD
jgi:hypothetical protein